MAQLAYPFDSSPATVARWARLARQFSGSGVVSSVFTTASPDYALTWNGLTGSVGFDTNTGVSLAYVRGFIHELSTAPWTFTVPANTSTTADRVDRVVLRRDLTAQTLQLVHLQGAPAATPTPPALQRGDAYDQLLWQFTVPRNGATAVTGVLDCRAFLSPGGGSQPTYLSPAARDADQPAPFVGQRCTLAAATTNETINAGYVIAPLPARDLVYRDGLWRLTSATMMPAVVANWAQPAGQFASAPQTDLTFVDVPDPGFAYRIRTIVSAELGAVAAGTRYDLLVNYLRNLTGTRVGHDQIFSPAEGTVYQRVVTLQNGAAALTGTTRVYACAQRAYGTANGNVTQFGKFLVVAREAD